MKVTIDDVFKKIRVIDSNIQYLENRAESDKLVGPNPLDDVIELLYEYRAKIMNTKVEI